MMELTRTFGIECWNSIWALFAFARLPNLKAFIKAHPSHAPDLVYTGLQDYQSNKRSAHAHSYLVKSKGKGPTKSNEKQLTGAIYLGMGEDEKSHQRYTMMAVETEPPKVIGECC